MEYHDPFHALLVDTYQIARQVDAANFKAAILQRLKQVVPLDTAFWMTRSEVDTPYVAEETYTYNLPPDVQDNYIRHPTVLQQALELNRVLMENIGTTIDVKSIIPQEQWLSSDMYLLHCKKYDIEHSIMTLYPSDHNQMIASISLNRHAHNPEFSEQQRLLIQRFVPHMVEAERINTIHSMQRSERDRVLRAVVDKHGHIIEASPRFNTAIMHLGLDAEGTICRDVLQQRLADKRYFQLVVRQEASLAYLELHQPPLDQLISARKLQLAHLLALGHPNKTIAAELHLSLDTVNDYVKELYQILAVNSRYEAIGQLLAMSNTQAAEHESGTCARQRFIGAQLLFSHQGDLLYSDDCLAELAPELSDVIATRLQHSECQYHYDNGLIISLDKRKEFLLASITDMSAYADCLTAREIQVAFLIGQFFSNAAIAGALGISVKTVENQLTRIYQKLTLRNRSELVAQLNQSVGLQRHLQNFQELQSP